MSYAPGLLPAAAPAMILSTSRIAGASFLVGPSTPASATWPAANEALYIPFHVSVPTPVMRLFVANGATAASAWCVAIYRADYTRIYTSGAVTQSGTNGLQFHTVSPLFTLPPGSYFMGMSAALTTVTVFRHTMNSVDYSRFSGMFTQSTAHPLPDPMVPVQATRNILPYFGISTVTAP